MKSSKKEDNCEQGVLKGSEKEDVCELLFIGKRHFI